MKPLPCLLDLTPTPSPKAEGNLTLLMLGSYFLTVNILLFCSFQLNISNAYCKLQRRGLEFFLVRGFFILGCCPDNKYIFKNPTLYSSFFLCLFTQKVC